MIQLKFIPSMGENSAKIELFDTISKTVKGLVELKTNYNLKNVELVISNVYWETSTVTVHVENNATILTFH